MTLRPVALIYLLSLCLQLTGCASIYANRANLADQVDTWLQNDQYELALDTIAAMSPDHKDYNYLSNSVAVIEKKRQAYVQKTLTEAASFEPSQDWRNAENAIEAGLDKLPSSPELTAQLNHYRLKRVGRIAMDDAAITLAKAYYIIAARPHQESKLYNSDNRFFAQQQFNQFLDQARQVSRELYALGHQYWIDGKFVQAREALSLSIKTASNDLSSELLASILLDEQEKRTVARAKQQKEMTEQQPELEASFYERINFGDFVGAQQVLNEMKAMSIKTVPELQDNLNEQKTERVNQLISSGNTLYNSGFLREAITRWQQALALDPQNVIIQQKLDRANTFVSNLERWTDNP